MKGRSDEVIDFFIKEVKDLPKIEKDVNLLLERIKKPVKLSGEWKGDYQRISEIEINGKKILEALTPLSEVPIGLGDAFISLRTACERAKTGLRRGGIAKEKDIESVEVNRKNFVARARNFVEDMESKEREALHRILTLVDENRRMKKRILELQIENEKLKKNLDKNKK